MALRAQEISQEAGSKIAQAIKDVINAAAGLAGFAIESARDIVQYMVRRGQMTQEEADRIIREAEEAHGKRKPAAKQAASPPSSPPVVAPPVKKPALAITPEKPATARPVSHVKPVAKAAKNARPTHAASRPAAKKQSAASRPKASAKKTAKKKR